MANGELTYDDFLQRLDIQDVLVDAGYHLNKRDGLRYPSYIRTDSNGTRIRGDKFIVTGGGKCCFQPPQQKLYNIISFIKSFPEKFVAEGKRRQRETLERGTLTEDGDVLANFFVSCVPWLYYTQIKEPAGGADDSNPRFAWGKYREENGRMMLPMSLFINHALCDGWHVTQFYKNLDRELAELSAYLKTQNEQQ